MAVTSKRNAILYHDNQNRIHDDLWGLGTHVWSNMAMGVSRSFNKSCGVNRQPQSSLTGTASKRSWSAFPAALRSSGLPAILLFGSSGPSRWWRTSFGEMGWHGLSGESQSKENDESESRSWRSKPLTHRTLTLLNLGAPTWAFTGSIRRQPYQIRGWLLALDAIVQDPSKPGASVLS